MFSVKKWPESDCLEMDPAWLPSSRSPGGQAPRRVGHTLLPRPFGGGLRERWRKVAGPTRHRSHIFFWTWLIVFRGFTLSIPAALHLGYYRANDSKGLIRAQLGLLPLRGGGLAGWQGPVWWGSPPQAGAGDSRLSCLWSRQEQLTAQLLGLCPPCDAHSGVPGLLFTEARHTRASEARCPCSCGDRD